MKETLIKVNNNKIVDLKNNKNCDIHVVVGNNDDLSRDSIYNIKDEPKKLEDRFNDRLEYSCYVLNKNLPKELQNDFEIKSKMDNGKLNYYLDNKTVDAFEKFPKKISFTMQFPSVEVANEFRKNGIEKLQEEADKTKKPVKVPFISDMKDYIGDYLEPLSYVNQYGLNGTELYLMPRNYPKAEKYKIEFYDKNIFFSIITSLRLSKKGKTYFILDNKESLNEEYKVSLKVKDIKENTDSTVNFKIIIKINIKEKYKNRCINNLEMFKYRILKDGKNTNLLVTIINDNKLLFNIHGCGHKSYTTEDYKKINNTIDLVSQIIYIEKCKNIKFKYDLEQIYKSSDMIDFIISEINKEEYSFPANSTWDYTFLNMPETRDFSSRLKPLYLKTELPYIIFLNRKIYLSDNELLLNNCIIKDVKEDTDKLYIKLQAESSVCKFGTFKSNKVK